MDHCGIRSSDILTYCHKILQDNQRHLFCHMLDLLKNDCSYIKNSELSDGTIQFWMIQILPLVFDNEQSIQMGALAAVEKYVQVTTMSVLHKSCYWNTIKKSLLYKYSPCIQKFQEEGNKMWHQVWCVFIRILDREILKGASIINIFLSIVERGFRNSCQLIRRDAFVCWRSLIELFFNYNELKSEKRLKLIIIPLKSSHSKSFHVTEIKLRVWWYFITCLETDLGKHFVTIVEPFLYFIVGALECHNSSVILRLGLLCIAMLIVNEPNEFLYRALKENQLEINQQETKTILTLFRSHWPIITNVGVKMLHMVGDFQNKSSEKELLNLILKYFLNLMLRLDLAAYSTYFLREVTPDLSNFRIPLQHIINHIASKGIYLHCSIDDLNNYKDIICAMSKLVFAAKHIVPRIVLQQCIDKMFLLDAFENSINFIPALTILFMVVLEEHGDDSLDIFETKMLIWLSISRTVLNFLTKNESEFFTKNKFNNMYNNWILWPILKGANLKKEFYNENFCVAWRELLEKSFASSEQSRLLDKVETSLHKLLSTNPESNFFADIFDAYVSIALKLDLEQRYIFCKKIMTLMQNAFSSLLEEKQKRTLMNTLSRIFISLGVKLPSEHFEDVKSTLLCVINAVNQGQIEEKFFKSWKQHVLENIPVQDNSNYTFKFKEIFNNYDSYVVPTCWILKPETLIERQRDIFLDKSNGPFVYPIKQTEDSCIKLLESKNNNTSTYDIQIQKNKRRIVTRVNTNRNSCHDISENNRGCCDFSKSNSGSNCLTILKADRFKKDFNESPLLYSQDYKAAAEANSTSSYTDCKINANTRQNNEAFIIESEGVLLNEEVKEGQKSDHLEISLLESPALCSPPGRKLTSNLSSPVLRSKPSSHLLGRGAQLINMIRCRNTNSQVFSAVSVAETYNLGNAEHCIPSFVQPNDFLFSKRLPSSNASPSASILKRKLCQNSRIELSESPPLLKRKRVSFQDPPVSFTKEYEIFGSVHIKEKPERCLQIGKAQGSQTDNTNNVNVANKLENIVEPKKKCFVKKKSTKLCAATKSNSEKRSIRASCSPLNEFTNFDYSVSKSLNGSELKTIDSALNLVIQECPLNIVLQKYFENQKSVTDDNAKILSTFVSDYMISNNNFKQQLLEILSETHSKDFLDHAVQENLSSVVCDRLNINSVIEYVCAKSKINSACRNNLLERIPDVLKSSKSDTELVLFHKNLQQISLTDNQIFYLITHLVNNRYEHKNNVI